MRASDDPVLIIGAGPAGLLTAAALDAREIPFEIVDAGRGPGGIWDIDRAETPMYESAHFISSKTLSGFPGFPMPDDYPDYPRHDRILAYIRAFAEHHDLPSRSTFGVRVEQARRRPEGGWRVELDDGSTREGSALCVATGMTWHPRPHPLQGRFEGEEFHSFHYRAARAFDGKRVLVVGGGNSGVDIACDAARTAAAARISLRRGYHFIPKHVFGQPADVFADRGPKLPNWLEEKVFGLLMRVLVGDLTRFGLPAPDHPILRSHPIVNTQILHHLAHGDLEARPDVEAVDGDRVRFEDGTEESFDLLVWATGYEWRFPFLDDAEVDRTDGRLDLWLNLFHRRHPDLFFLGIFETDGAAYELFARQAEVVAACIEARRRGMPLEALDRDRREARPDLTGGRRYLKSARHGHYVRGELYRRALDRVLRRIPA